VKIRKLKIIAYLLPILIFFSLTGYCGMQYFNETKLQKQLNNIETADRKIQKTVKSNKYGYSDVITAVENSKKMQFINFKIGDVNNKSSIEAIIEYNGDISSLNEGIENLLSKDNFKDFKAINIKNDKGNIKANIDAEFIQTQMKK
jgi:hypothetical protein